MLMSVAAGSGLAQHGSEWRERIDLTRLLADSAALDKLVIIYRPTYRQTLFVFGTGRIALQTYPPESFPRSTSLLPTCTADVSRTDVKEIIMTMIETQFFDLPQKSFVDTGEYSNDIEFEKNLKAHDIIVHDGSSRASRDFAEGTYRGKQEQIPAAFATVEAKLIRLADVAASKKPCPMAHYMEWLRTGRGETSPDSTAKE
jgi:hypothetical protein